MVNLRLNHPMSLRARLTPSQIEEYMKLGTYVNRAIEEIEGDALTPNELKTRVLKLVRSNSCSYLVGQLRVRVPLDTLYMHYRKLKGIPVITLSQRADFERADRGYQQVRGSSSGCQRSGRIQANERGKSVHINHSRSFKYY